MIAVRPAVLSDAEDILAVNRECFGYEHDVSVVQSALTRCAEEGTLSCFSAIADDVLAGYIQAQIVHPVYSLPVCYVHALAVLPVFRRRGAAKALVTAVEKWAIAMGAQTISLHSGTDRKTAHAFYAAFGYKVRKHVIHFVKPLNEEENHGHF
ncbi:MAG: GNAT family N-acetyltransferase [Clostridia bacterium]|nr:GNAT family N-acetyltransferase [Clostridia bacterium]